MMTPVLRVLYVDDEPDLLDIGKLFLEESGDFAVTTAISAPEGIRLLEQGPERFRKFQLYGYTGLSIARGRARMDI